MVQERPNPYDRWKRFKLPLHLRFGMLFLSKQERVEVENRINKINFIREKERRDGIDEMRRRLRPPPQKAFPGPNIQKE